MTIKSVIFDLDGVILDDTQPIVDAYRETARSLGLRIPEDKEIARLFGIPHYQLVSILWPGCDLEEFRKNFSKIVESKSFRFKLVNNAENVIRKLKENGIKLGIVTGGVREWTMINLKKARLDSKLFDVITSASDTKNHKPKGDPILYTCEKLGTKKDDAVFVGDSPIDYEAAKDAGVNFVGVLTGVSDKEDFKKLGVKNVINSIEDLLNLFKLDENKTR